MVGLKALSKFKMAGRRHYWRGTIEIDEHELHAICDEIQTEYNRAIEAINKAAGNWAKAEAEAIAAWNVRATMGSDATGVRLSEKLQGIADEMRNIGASSMTPHALLACYAYEIDKVADSLKFAVTLGGEINGDTSDGYHTFNELYHHRAVLFSVIVRDHRELAWKARKHHDGTMYDGMFIVGIETPKGQATYHYDIDPYWKMFDCEEREFAPEWDGHTSDEAIARIAALNTCAEHGTLTAEQVRMAIFNSSSYASYDGAKYYADGISMQAIADELNARVEQTCKKLPSLIDQTCIVRQSCQGTVFEREFGYWRCSECQCENFDGAKRCMECGAKVVE